MPANLLNSKQTNGPSISRRRFWNINWLARQYNVLSPSSLAPFNTISYFTRMCETKEADNRIWKFHFPKSSDIINRNVTENGQKIEHYTRNSGYKSFELKLFQCHRISPNVRVRRYLRDKKSILVTGTSFQRPRHLSQLLLLPNSHWRVHFHLFWKGWLHISRQKIFCSNQFSPHPLHFTLKC